MEERISLAHGDGGKLAHQLIKEIFVKEFGHLEHSKFDSAVLSLEQNKIAVSTDSFVIKPYFFPGGNIGKLAVAGTVNDLAVSGAIPRYLTAGFIIEEGFKISDLKKIVASMAEEAKKAEVLIITGDTKVVDKGSVDGIYINTTGIGLYEDTLPFNPNKIQEGDLIIVSGTIGDHGIAILSARGELGISNDLESDCASLNHLIEDIMQSSKRIKIMRDPTRGGLATTLVEICEDFNVSMEIEERLIPVKNEVQGTCNILGYEPIYLANEGKVIIIADKEDEERITSVLKSSDLGKEAKVIGRVTGRDKGRLYLKTSLGSTRRLERLSGIMLPRIC